ncbi:MAG: adenylate/guanylate cyclase domain-containing protein, partial [bacterium]
GTIMASKGAIFVFDRDNSVLSELTSISIKEQFKDCTLSGKFVENISSYQYSHFEFDNSIDWIEGDLRNYLKSSNSKIIIPLFHKSKLLGILCIGEKFMSEKFTDIDYKILEIISNHLTEALFNYELLENVEQKKRELNIKLLELETLFDIGVAISSVLDVNELAEDVLFRAIGVLNASKGMFIRQNDQSPILDILSMFNWGDSKFLLSKKIDVLNKLNDGEGGLILTSNEKTELQKKLKENNLLVVPLRAKENLLGFMILCDKETRSGVEDFNELDLDILTSLSNQAAVAMDNAKLFKEITEAKQFNESILGSIATGVITINVLGEVDSVNKAGENILKMDKDSIINNHYMFLFEKDPDVIEIITKTELSKKITTEINIPFLTASQETIVNVSAAPRIDINGNTEGLVIAIEDISDVSKVKNTFKRYVSKQVVDNLLEDETKLNLGGEEREVTILFTDIRGFTSMSENMEPEQVVMTLNEYFSEMIDIVFKHNGTLDKIIGDELMVVFGAPLAAEDDTERALNTAVEMQNKIKELNDTRKQRGEDPVLVGAGINKGFVVSGNIGSRDMMDYTVIGDTVNLGSRLCSAAGPGEIIVSKEVIKNQEDKFLFKELEPILVKGKKNKINIFKVNY